MMTEVYFVDDVVYGISPHHFDWHISYVTLSSDQLSPA